MDISIIPIGNSKGIRLSKTLLKKYNIKDKVELILEKGYIILKPKAEPRKGWIVLDQIRTIDKQRIIKALDNLNEKEIEEVKLKLKETFID